MEKQVLQEKILKVTELSEEHIEKVFESFLKKVSEVLDINQTIKIENIGFFQLKKEPVSRLERDSSKKSKKILIYKSVESIRSLGDENFLKLEIESTHEEPTAFSDSVFNLSIDKPSTIFDESESEAGKQTDEELENSIQSKIKELVASGVILDGYELLNKDFISADEESEAEDISVDDIDEKSMEEFEKQFSQSEEFDDSLIEDSIIKESEKDLDTDFHFDESLTSDEQKEEIVSEESEIEAASEPEHKSPFDELNDLVNKEKKSEVEENVNSQTVYDEVKSSLRKNDKGNKRLLILLFASVFVILLIAIIYFTSAPSTTQTQTFVAQKETTPQKPIPPAAKVDTTVTDSVKSKETTSEVVLLKNESKKQIKKEIPKQAPKTNYTGLYRKIPNDVRITDRIYFDGKKYTIQISSWKSRTIAQHEVQRLKKRGFDAFIYKVFIKSKNATYNRVRVGYFNTKNEAAQFLKSNKL
ncbi:hypothetical protein MNBD_IGNAVI01-632 [hydrothermal vent metagenome]|uniref:SPOR domain-containing protein n=1 Tax=hydrothermal vent metagenome TaxID=652676 RepID=A0A3B1DDF7_9ZZZZ